MKVFLVRHPEPIGGQGVCYGRTDLDVAPDEVDAVAAHVRANIDGPVDWCVSSPSRRCTKLAAVLADEVQCDDRLMELDFGAWESKRWDDIDKVTLDNWSTDYVHRRPPQGESWGMVQQRVSAFIDDLRESDKEHVVIVTHGGVIRAFISLILGVDLEAMWHIQVPFRCVVTIDLGYVPIDDKFVALSGS